MVLNFITISNLYKAMEALKENGYKVEVSQIAVARGRGNSCMLMANNPILIICSEKIS